MKVSMVYQGEKFVLLKYIFDYMYIYELFKHFVIHA